MITKKILNKNIVLVVIGFSMIIAVTKISLLPAIFTLIAILITSSKKCNPKHLISYVGGYLALINITYALPINYDNLFIFLYLVISIIYFGRTVGDFDIGQKRSITLFLTPLLFLIAQIIAERFQKTEELLMNIVFNLGYDQVGHFAIARTLERCGEFLYLCDPNSLLLPLNYMFYPQQWHILFSSFINNDTMFLALGTYLLALVVSTFICFYLISQSAKYFTQNIDGIRFKKYTNIMISKEFLLASLILVCITIALMGYPNFLLSLSLFVFAITLHDRNSSSSYLLVSLCLIVSTSMYTFLLVPGVLFFIYRTILFKVPILIKISSSLLWLVFVYFVVTITFDKNHVDYIGIGEGSYSLVVGFTQIVLFVGLILNLLQLKNKLIKSFSSAYDLFIVNAILLGCLLGLNALIIYLGNSSGYYLIKFSYFAFILGAINLFVTLSKNDFRIPTPSMTPLSIGIILAATLYLIARLPFSSPFYNLVNIVAGPSMIQQERILNIYSAARVSESSGKPVVLLTSNSGSDTQWANSLSGNWSSYLNEFLENKIDNEIEFRDLNFQEQNKNNFVFFDLDRR
jgi:hypothetical protein